MIESNHNCIDTKLNSAVIKSPFSDPPSLLYQEKRTPIYEEDSPTLVIATQNTNTTLTMVTPHPQ